MNERIEGEIRQLLAKVEKEELETVFMSLLYVSSSSPEDKEEMLTRGKRMFDELTKDGQALLMFAMMGQILK